MASWRVLLQQLGWTSEILIFYANSWMFSAMPCLSILTRAFLSPFQCERHGFRPFGGLWKSNWYPEWWSKRLWAFGWKYDLKKKKKTFTLVLEVSPASFEAPSLLPCQHKCAGATWNWLSVKFDRVGIIKFLKNHTQNIHPSSIMRLCTMAKNNAYLTVRGETTKDPIFGNDLRGKVAI